MWGCVCSFLPRDQSAVIIIQWHVIGNNKMKKVKNNCDARTSN